MKIDKETTIARCPFCNGKPRAMLSDTTVYVNAKGGYSTTQVLHSIECRNCGGRTLWCEKLEDAISAWNRRYDSYEDDLK